eukprot:Colp12_sorted_trinity150504_noHs@6735
MALTYEFVNPNAVVSELCCPICNGPVVDPIVHTSCDEMMCRTCVIFNSCKCPFDDLTVDPASPEDVRAPSRGVKALLDEILVRCIRCEKVTRRGDHGNHICLQACPQNCGKNFGSLQDLEAHGYVCREVVITCPADQCNVQMKRGLMQQHLLNCTHAR